jgi:hypothetical protein
MARPIFAQINLAALASNVAMAREKAPRAQLLAVVKADAYGHGLLRVLPAPQSAQVDVRRQVLLFGRAEFAQRRLQPAPRQPAREDFGRLFNRQGRHQPTFRRAGQVDPADLPALRLGKPFHKIDQVQNVLHALFHRQAVLRVAGGGKGITQAGDQAR